MAMDLLTCAAMIQEKCAATATSGDERAEHQTTHARAYVPLSNSIAEVDQASTKSPKYVCAGKGKWPSSADSQKLSKALSRIDLSASNLELGKLQLSWNTADGRNLASQIEHLYHDDKAGLGKTLCNFFEQDRGGFAQRYANIGQGNVQAMADALMAMGTAKAPKAKTDSERLAAGLNFVGAQPDTEITVRRQVQWNDGKGPFEGISLQDYLKSPRMNSKTRSELGDFVSRHVYVDARGRFKIHTADMGDRTRDALK